jgi:hypothetical protein
MNENEHSTVLNLPPFAASWGADVSAGDTSTITTSILRGAKAAESAAPLAALPGAGLAPAQLLGAVSYCYAKGIYDSAAIENKMRQNPEMRTATHDNIPDAALIRRFRRLNRGAIRATLEEAFRFLRRKQRNAMHPPLPGQPATAAPVGTLMGETTVTFVRKEAERTLNDAAFADNMSRD